MAAKAMRRPACRSVTTCTWAAFDPTTFAVAGSVPGSSSTMNSWPAYALAHTSWISSSLMESALSVIFALTVARMPRAIGASIGVNPSVNSSARAASKPAAWAKFCKISGIWRCVPPTP